MIFIDCLPFPIQKFLLVDDGDEVIIPTPYWVTYSELVKIARGKVVEIRSTVEDGFKVSPAQVEAAITSRTKVFMFSSPNNPSGAVYNKAELEALANLFKKYPGITILSDEIYEYIHFGDNLTSIGSIPSLQDRVITVNGFSKSYAMTGWRITRRRRDPRASSAR